ncbi:MAG: hypothetical protein K2Y21_13070 [Phycisphaerales bacterium]|nr:hypothetical protein [Phycisphaerales bacterium]
MSSRTRQSLPFAVRQGLVIGACLAANGVIASQFRLDHAVGMIRLMGIGITLFVGALVVLELSFREIDREDGTSTPNAKRDLSRAFSKSIGFLLVLAALSFLTCAAPL